MRQLAICGSSTAKIGSNSDRSITWPAPPRSATRSAVIVANAPCMPAIMSASASGGSAGGRSGKPFRCAKPLIASTSVPKPGLCE